MSEALRPWMDAHNFDEKFAARVLHVTFDKCIRQQTDDLSVGYLAKQAFRSKRY